MPPYRSIRRPAVAGSWYPGNSTQLARLVDDLLDEGGPARCDPAPLALVLPHAGYRYSGPTAGKAVATVRDCDVRRVWLLGPSHHLALRGVGAYTQDAFQTPLGFLPLDREVLDTLADKPGFRRLASDGGEHSLEMELPLLQRALGAFELVPLLVGSLDPETARQVADAIRPELGPHDLVVVSSDFTHYGVDFGYTPFGPVAPPEKVDELDHGAWKRLAAADPDGLYAYLQETGATICGRNPLLVLAALLEGHEGARGVEVAYANSGELTGDWHHAVFYLSARFEGPAWQGRGPQPGRAHLVAPDTARALLDLARKTLDHYFQTGGELLEVDPSTLPADASRVLGAFVTLEKHGQLRGCIGEITPRRAAWQAVREHAIDAAVHDPRFPPVTAEEWPELTVEVSLLGPNWKVDGPRDWIIGRHGIVLSRGWRRATFLPQVAPEQGWDRETTLRYLARKAGIPESEIPHCTIEVYEAQVVGEAEH